MAQAINQKQIIAYLLCLTTIILSACSSTKSNADLQSNFQDETAWRSFQDQALTAGGRPNTTDAEAIWKKAIVYFDARNKNSDQAIEARWFLAKYYEFNSDFGKAETLFSEIVANKEKFHSSQYTGLPANISDLADCYYFQGQYKQAADLYIRALAVAQVISGPRAQVADTRKLANCYAQLGDKPLAAIFYQKAITLGGQITPLVGPMYGYIVTLDTFIAVKDYATMLSLAGKTSELNNLKTQATMLAARIIGQATTPASMMQDFASDKPEFQTLYKQLQGAPTLADLNLMIYKRAENAAAIACHSGQYAVAEDIYERLLEFAVAGKTANQVLADFNLHHMWCDCMQAASPGAANSQVENPYLTAFQLIRSKQEYSDKKLMFTHKFAWAIPNQEALETIAGYGPIIEIGAGTGYWAYLLRQMHVDIIADDLTPVPSKNNLWHFCAGASWTNVEQGDENLVTKYPQRTLMLCWPDGGRDLFSYNALSKYKGNRLIYIGEEASGYTGCPQFFDLLKQDWHLVKKVDIPRWPNNYDSLYVLERNT